MNIRRKEDVDKPKHFDLINEADVIFFTGGDQVRLVEIFQNSELLELIRDRFSSGVTIAGTSAGAAAASNPMIYDGDNQGFLKGTVSWCEGFGFLSNITIDTHFMERERVFRLTQFLASRKSKYGIGLSEDMAVVISPNKTLEVLGNRVITILSSNNLHYTNYNEIDIDDQITVDGLSLGFLSEGTIFDIEKWKVIR